MKIFILIILVSFNLLLLADENSVKIIEKEYAKFLNLIKDGKVEEALLFSSLNEKEMNEIFNDKAPKEKIVEFLNKINEHQKSNKDKLVNEIAPRMKGDLELKVEPKIIEKEEVHSWLKENVTIYKLHLKYPDGTTAGTGTAIVFNNKFKFIRNFDKLPEGIKLFEEKYKK